VQRAFDLWYELEQLTDQHLLTPCRCLSLGPANGQMIQSLEACVREHHLPAQRLTAAEIRRLFPPFHLPDHYVGILEDQAGFLAVEACVWAQLTVARLLGAQLRLNEPVLHWHAHDNGFRVITPQGSYCAPRLIICAGAWTHRLLRQWNIPLAVMRQVMLWFDVGTRRRAFRRDQFPIFIAETPRGSFYGLPAIDSLGLKVAQHYGAPEVPDPELVQRQTTPADVVAVRHFLDEFLPGLGSTTQAHTCLYTVTPDRHFIIDRLPANQASLVIAAGFSGHGFKFAPVVGQILADLVSDGQTHWNLQLFRMHRFWPPGSLHPQDLKAS
jgi:sarcosine oxidase